MSSVLVQARSALKAMGTKFGQLAALSGPDAEGTGKALKRAQTTLNNMAKQAGQHAAAAGSLVSASRAGDSFKLVEKSNQAKKDAEELAARVHSLVADLEKVRSAFNHAKKAADDTANSL